MSERVFELYLTDHNKRRRTKFVPDFNVVKPGPKRYKRPGFNKVVTDFMHETDFRGLVATVGSSGDCLSIRTSFGDVEIDDRSPFCFEKDVDEALAEEFPGLSFLAIVD